MINKGKLRTLLEEVGHLVDMNCHTEARLKIAVAFDLYDVARLLMALDTIHTIEKDLPRALITYREHLTLRVLRVVEKNHGTEVKDKLFSALYRSNGEALKNYNGCTD